MINISSTIKDFIFALGKRHTYNLLKNTYIWLGFLWGIPIPFIILGLHRHAIEPLDINQHYLSILQLHPIYWIFVIHPFIFAIIFGAFGTIHHEKDSKINDLITQLKIESSHDTLTHLYNRGFFELVLQQEINRMERQGGLFSLAMFDIDHFKEVNDQYGHLIGDRVLKSLGIVIRVNSRIYDTPARWGGEEFTLVLPNTPPSEAANIIERIRTDFSEHVFSAAKQRFSCTVSVGLTSYRLNDTPSSIIERADQALYNAKNSGRNCYKIYPSTDPKKE